MVLIGSGLAQQSPRLVVGREHRCAADTTGVEPGEQQASCTACIHRHAHCPTDAQPARYVLTVPLNRTGHMYKGKGFPYSTLSIGPGADPGVQAVSLQVIHPPGLQLPPQPQSITALWPVPSYTAWSQRHIGVNNLPKVVTHRCLEQDLNPRPTDRKPKCLTVAPPRYQCMNVCMYVSFGQGSSLPWTHTLRPL